ncbi:MAG TPA: metallophosphoesterase [Methylibium sp.]|uniref:metallophosphoesterase family protein n=1 Tax=Methylibium sp. TaxID=2067992 RepID=UPI002DB5EE24|nr:metallophosphoesterase [Methylibium sp.]HEU4459628.1 metallophosphoesterase [Methylibium sp.]
MALLLHVSDPHFGTERAEVVEALIALGRRLQPELVVLSGDITQRARHAQFEAARRFVERLAPRSLLAIPGNHDLPLYDLPRRLFAPYGRYRRAFGAELEPVYRSARLLAIGVNTTRPWRHVNGVVSPAQVRRVGAALRAAPPELLRVVVVHQPIAVLRDQDAPDLLRGRDAALGHWAEAGAQLVLGGHIHLPYVAELPAAAPHRWWAVQAGTAVSVRVRHEAGNSVNVLRRDDAGACAVERWDYAAGSGGFERVEVQALPFLR